MTLKENYKVSSFIFLFVGTNSILPVLCVWSAEMSILSKQISILWGKNSIFCPQISVFLAHISFCA